MPPIVPAPQLPLPLQSGRAAAQQQSGDRMRRETGRALEFGLKHGCLRTGLEEMVEKIAAVAAAAGSAFTRRPLMQAHGSGVAPPQPVAPAYSGGPTSSSVPISAAQHPVMDQLRQHLGATGPAQARRPTPAAPAQAAGTAASAAAGTGMMPPPQAPPGALTRFYRGGRRAAMIGGLGAAGAVALGMGHRGEDEERQRWPAVYAPLGGGFY